MRHSFSFIIIAFCIYGAALMPSVARAQSGRVAQEKAAPTPSVSNDARPASALYEEAEAYVREKFAQFNRDRVPYDKNRANETYAEQQELAARYAKLLSARTSLAGEDLYYLGMLYRLADSSEEALNAFKRYLETKPASPNEHAQTARLELLTVAAELLKLEEAERARTEYQSNQPQNAEGRLLMEGLLAAAYRQAKNSTRRLSTGARRLPS